MNISAGSSYRVNGTPISGGGISTQNIVTGSRALGGGPYTNGTGKPMMVTVTVNGAPTSVMAASTDSGSATTVVAQQTNTSGTTASLICLSFWVLAGNVYKVTTSGGTLSSWVEWY